MSEPSEVDYVETDYTLDVICEHVNPHRRGESAPLLLGVPPRRVALVYFLPTPAHTVGLLEWRVAEMPENPDYPGALQTYFGEVRRLTAGFPPSEASRILRSPDERDQLLSNDSRVMDGTRWRFWCRDCESTVTAQGGRVEPVFAGLRRAGVSRITLRGLASTLNT